MRDGNGNTLSADEVAKVKAVETGKTDASVNITSVDPKTEHKPAAPTDTDADRPFAEPPAPGF